MSLYDLSKKGPKFPMDTKRIYHRDAQIDSGMHSVFRQEIEIWFIE